LANKTNSTLVLRHYLMMRCLTMLGLAAGVIGISLYFALQPPILPCLIIFAVLAGATWLTSLRKNPIIKVRHTDLVWNLLLDIVALYAFTFYTGGASNPFVTLFALPVIFAAATLPMRGSATIAIAAVTAYTITMFVNVPVNSDGLNMEVSSEYLWGNWYAFVLLVAGIAALVARLSRHIQQRESELAEAREDALQTDRTIALGALAASAAHDLGTPLATIAVLARDLETEAKDEDSRKRLVVLNTAVGTCKKILTSLASSAGQQKADSSHVMSADTYIENLVQQWSKRHPQLVAKLKQSGDQPTPQILADRALDQALLTLLGSATAATTTGILFAMNWSAEMLSIEANPLEPTPDATGNYAANLLHSDTMDAGVILAIASLKRMGANVNLNPIGGAGAAIQVSIPMSQIKTA
jgi:two-component system sensor histidine kinase RegB